MDHKVEHPSRTEEMHTTPRKQGGVMNKLYPPGPKPGAGGRVKNHCRKFWWCGKSQRLNTFDIRANQLKTAWFLQ
jgi:hypothetical protein